MKFTDIIKGRAAIQKVANREGKSYAEIESAIQEAIDLAWEDLSVREYQNMLFPKGKPAAAEYVGRVGRYIA